MMTVNSVGSFPTVYSTVQSPSGGTNQIYLYLKRVGAQPAWMMLMLMMNDDDDDDDDDDNVEEACPSSGGAGRAASHTGAYHAPLVIMPGWGTDGARARLRTVGSTHSEVGCFLRRVLRCVAAFRMMTAVASAGGWSTCGECETSTVT